MTVNSRIIGFFYVPLKLSRTVAVLGNGAKSRSIAVEPVYRAEGERGVKACKKISKRISLMLYRGMNGHTAGLVKNNKRIVFKGYGNVKRRIGVERFFVAGSEDYYISRINSVYRPYRFTVPRYSAVSSFQPCEESS